MPNQRGRTRSRYRLTDRREIAYEKFMKGATVQDVADDLEVTWDTAKRYKVEYESRVQELARANPSMLIEVIQNSIKALEENDLVRKKAWDEYEAAGGRVIECEHCASEILLPPTPSTVRNSYLKTILSAQEQRAKIYGLFGVKAEFYGQVQKIKSLQDKLLDFMRTQLCPEDRRKLERFIMGEEGDIVDLPELAAIDE